MQRTKKNRRCLYTDGDLEDLSIVQIRSYERVTPKFLSPVNVFNNPKSSKKPDLSPVENKDFNISTTSDNDKYYFPKSESKDEYENSGIIPFVNRMDESISPANNEMIIFVSQNVQGLKSNARSINLDAIVQNMINSNVFVYCIQETWLDGNFIKEIEGYTVFHRG